ncbi:unnamed protein product [Mytilus edulis]|uniref:TTF-type domain-containing protein n=1 Tax=Mytilus edulis TaxID=6550 RepID=A0A8S3Q8Y8_MYTED|nr:unnamed protein product [Mytilus edulis]
MSKTGVKPPPTQLAIAEENIMNAMRDSASFIGVAGLETEISYNILVLMTLKQGKDIIFLNGKSEPVWVKLTGMGGGAWWPGKMESSSAVSFWSDNSREPENTTSCTIRDQRNTHGDTNLREKPFNTRRNPKEKRRLSCFVYTDYKKKVKKSMQKSDDVDLDAQPQIESDVDLEAQSQIESDEDLEAQFQIESDVDLEAQSQIESDVDLEAQFQIESDVDLEAQSQIESDRLSQIESDVDLEAQSQIESDVDLEAQSQIESDEDLEAQSQIESDVDFSGQFQIESDVDLEAQSQIESDVDFEAQSQIESDEDLEAQSQIESDEDLEAQSQIESDVDLEAQSQIESDVDLEAQLTENVDQRMNGQHNFESVWLSNIDSAVNHIFGIMICDDSNCEEEDHGRHHEFFRTPNTVMIRENDTYGFGYDIFSEKMSHLVLKPKHTLIGKSLLPMILKFKSADDIDPENLARLKSTYPLTKYSVDELAAEFVKITGDELKNVMLLAGKDLDLDNSRLLLHQTILFANLIGAPKGSSLTDPRPQAGSSTFVPQVISKTHEEASCSDSQDSETNPNTKTQTQTQSLDPVGFIGKSLNDTLKSTILGSKWTPEKGKFSFPLTHGRRYNVAWEDKFNWLRYSPSTDSAFCAPCIAFGECKSSGGYSDKFSSSGMKDWKNAVGAKRGTFLIHQESSGHKDALLKSSNFLQIIEGGKKTSSVVFLRLTKIILRKINR